MKKKDFKDLLTSIDQARKIHSGKITLTKKRKKIDSRQKLIIWLKHRIKLLDKSRQHYEQNPTLTKNLKIANTVLIENDIEDLKKLLGALTCP